MTEQSCPRCRGVMYRSHSRTFLERARKVFTSRRPFRCESCGWRGWISELDAVSFAPVDPHEPPDLASIDTAMKGSRDADRDRGGFN